MLPGQTSGVSSEMDGGAAVRIGTVTLRVAWQPFESVTSTVSVTGPLPAAWKTTDPGPVGPGATIAPF